MMRRSITCSRLLTVQSQNGVKNLVVQPTHLMHGAEYDEMVEAIDGYTRTNLSP